MFVYPQDAPERLEYTKVLDHIRSYCMSDLGAERIMLWNVLTEIGPIEKALRETEEFRKVLDRGEVFPLSSFDSIEDDITMLKKDGYVLDIEAIQRIYVVIRAAVTMIDHVRDEEKRKFVPLISAIVDKMHMDPKLISDIDKVIDKDGEIRPDASPELLKITRQIKSRERECDKVFSQELEFFKTKGYLTESFESLRGGKRVLMVATEHKRKVPGIIHDESATGKTVFIEPEKVMPLHMEIYNLQSERKAELYKIIKDLCQVLRPHADPLLSAMEVLVVLDIIHAKAKYAFQIQGKRPHVQKKPCLHILQGYNPVLLLKNMSIGIPVVPFDLSLQGNNRILVLSGPNAGGKSVVMKSVGLLQLMIQSGILVPVNENSVFGVFQKVFVDIGDQQSLEDDLSTYSSHLKNMKETLENGGPDTLVLFDEFGAGTDPKIGGAMAEAVLFQLNKSRCSGVVTTHYSNLKFFAFKTKGLVNGSMAFDKLKLMPTYQLHVGKPGSSFAFEIARKTGLPADVIEYAQKKSGKNEKAIDEMLVSLMDEKKEFETKFEQVIEKQDRLDRLIKNYEQMVADLEVKKKKLKLEVKQGAAQVLHAQKQAVQKALQDIKMIKEEEKLLVIADELKKKQELAVNQVVELKKEVYDQEVKKASKPIEAGDFVKLRTGSSIGEVLRVHQQKAEVQLGVLKVTVPLIDLELSKEPIQVNTRKSINTDKVNKYLPESKIDIREYTKQDAVRLLEEFLDRALLHNMYELKIIHGHGKGVLKKEVWNILKQYKDVKKYWHPVAEEGGEGVTLVQF